MTAVESKKPCCKYGLEHQHTVGGMLCRNGKVLAVRKKGKRKFIITGGTHEKGETIKRGVKREFLEEVQLHVEVEELLGIFKGESLWKKGQTLAHVYLVSSKANPEPDNEIVEYKWVDSNFAKEGTKLGSILKLQVLPILKKRKLIN